MKSGLALACALLFTGAAFAEGAVAPSADADVRVFISQSDGTEADRSIDFFGSHVGGVGLPVLVTGMQVSVGEGEIALDAAAYRDLAFAQLATVETSASAAAASVAFDGGRPGSPGEAYRAAFSFARTPGGLFLSARTICRSQGGPCVTTTFPASWPAG